jgi:hypothetical protein
MAFPRGRREKFGGLQADIFPRCEVPAETSNLVTEEGRLVSEYGFAFFRIIRKDDRGEPLNVQLRRKGREDDAVRRQLDGRSCVEGEGLLAGSRAS